MMKYTTAIDKLRKLAKRIRGIQGGTSAGKTYGQLPVEIDYCIENPMTETSVVAESVPHLKRGAMKDFLKIMKETGRFNPKSWHATDKTYTFANGSYMEFFSADDDSKLRGGRRDRCYMNEANNMSFKVFTELASRTKGAFSMDWNPTEEFWFHEELLGDDDVDFIILTYKDNEGCPQSAIDFIEKAKKKGFYNTELPVEELFEEGNIKSSFWSNWFKVYGLGLTGSLEGVVYDNWSQIKSIPEDAVLLGYGMDFGFTNDATTVIALYKWNDKLIADEVIYETGLLNNDIVRLCNKRGVKGVIYADSSAPKDITDLKRMGLSIRGAKKGRDSIMYGIRILQSYPLLVTQRSTNLIKELRFYRWDKDKENKAKNIPIDAFNHGLDALRYIAMTKLSKKTNKTSIRSN